MICAQDVRTMLDDIDKSLLRALQANAQLTADALGARINLSASQAARRRQRLEQAGYITGYGARLAPASLGLNVQAFVSVALATQDPQTARSFTTLLQAQPEIVSVWTLTGEADYLLRIWTEDLRALNTLIHEVLLPHAAVSRVQSQIVMEQFKSDAPLPL